MTTLAMPPATRIQSPKLEWFAPLTRNELDQMEGDPSYRAFMAVSRIVGAWSSLFPAERRRRVLAEVPATVYVPIVDGLEAEVEGDAKVIDGDTQIEVWFKARFVRVIDGHFEYAVTVTDPDKEYHV